MDTREQMILLISDDAALCAAARRELESRREGLRVAAVSTIEAAQRVLTDRVPAVILIEDADSEPEGRLGRAPHLDAAVASLSRYAPVVVIGDASKESELTALGAAGAANYVPRSAGALPAALRLVEDHLRRAQSAAAGSVSWRVTLDPQGAEFVSEDFGEVLRHELNNPLTGILGNAELLLAEVRRKNDGRLPEGGKQRIETIAALAVRLRETVRRLSIEWESRHSAVH
jgi:signal transduction histidine kinase